MDLIRNTTDPQAASKTLVDHALQRFSTDNLSCMVVRFDNTALKQNQEEGSIGVEGDSKTVKRGVSEADALVSEAKKHQDDDVATASENAPATNSAHETIQEESEPKEEPIELNSAAVQAAQKNS